MNNSRNFGTRNLPVP